MTIIMSDEDFTPLKLLLRDISYEPLQKEIINRVFFTYVLFIAQWFIDAQAGTALFTFV